MKIKLGCMCLSLINLVIWVEIWWGRALLGGLMKCTLPFLYVLLYLTPFCVSLQWLVLRKEPLSEAKAELWHRGPTLRADRHPVWPGIEGLWPGCCLADICQVPWRINCLVEKRGKRCLKFWSLPPGYSKQFCSCSKLPVALQLLHLLILQTWLNRD